MVVETILLCDIYLAMENTLYNDASVVSIAPRPRHSSGYLHAWIVAIVAIQDFIALINT